MTSLSGSRALRFIRLSRPWICRSCMKSTQTQSVLQLSHRHRCTSSQTESKMSSTRTNQDEEDMPISYLSSKARDWSVQNSYGRHKKRPWYKVAPISLALTVFMAWVFLRKETEIDRQLEVHLHERLPNLFEDPNKKGVKQVTSTDAAVPEDENKEILKA